MSTSKLRVICTDGGTHPPRDLGLVQWTPDALHRDGFAVWDAAGDQTQHTPETVAEAGRTTRAGAWRTTKRSAVTTTTRKDGGATYTFPSCPTCNRLATILRDTTLGSVLRGGLTTLDVSEMP